MPPSNDPRTARRRQCGFTLIEIMIALLIGLFLMGALLTMVQTNRRVFGEQNQLAQVQDNERIALTMLTDIIQAAGYFPQQPVLNTLTGTMTAAAPFGVGQFIYGTYSATPPGPGDTITVRYMTAGGDGIINCSGQTTPAGPNVLNINKFEISNGQLLCTREDGTQFALVGGVAGSGLDLVSMHIEYGVRFDATAQGNNVDKYLTADLVDAAGLWNSVISVWVTLRFNNPLYVIGGSQPQFFDVQRVIGVMSQMGPVQ